MNCPRCGEAENLEKRDGKLVKCLHCHLSRDFDLKEAAWLYRKSNDRRYTDGHRYDMKQECIYLSERWGFTVGELIAA